MDKMPFLVISVVEIECVIPQGLSLPGIPLSVPFFLTIIQSFYFDAIVCFIIAHFSIHSSICMFGLHIQITSWLLIFFEDFLAYI